MAHIGRRREVAFTKEAVRGTVDGPDAGDFVRHSEHTVKTNSPKVYLQNAMGTISEDHEAFINIYETAGSIPVTLERSSMFLVGYAICGQAPVTTGSGPYVHTFTFDNDNNAHQSFTVHYTDPVLGDVSAPRGMFNTIDMEFVPDAYPAITFDILADKTASASYTPSYPSTFNEFKPTQVTFKYASNYAGLGAASAVSISKFKCVVQKNVEGYPVLGSDQYAEIVNKQTSIKGEIEAIFDATTYKNLAESTTTKSISMKLSDGTYSLEIKLPTVSFENWDESDRGNNSYVKQTIPFTATDADATNGIAIVVVTDATATH